MIVAMIVIGGVTRLTESGLSIMEWRPLTGIVPPLSEAEWNRVFALYQTVTPEDVRAAAQRARRPCACWRVNMLSGAWLRACCQSLRAARG